MKYLSFLIVLFLAVSAGAQKQEQEFADDSLYDYRSYVPPSHYDVRWLVDMPTAYMLPRGSFDMDFRTFPTGGLQAAINIGLADRFSLGLAYGGAKILSEEAPIWNPRIEFQIRYMLIEEYRSFPQIAVGYSSFGYGLYQERNEEKGYHENRYLVKSPGFYLGVSKRYPVYSSYFSLHGGINYSMEKDLDSDPNFFIGALADLGYSMVFLAEYDFAINDNKSAGIFGRGRGYLNLGLAWYITSELQLEFDFKNLLLNRRNLTGDDLVIDREIRLIYLQFFTN